MILSYVLGMIGFGGGVSASSLVIVYIFYFVSYGIFLTIYTVFVRKFVLKNTRKLIVILLTLTPLLTPIIYYGSIQIWWWNHYRQIDTNEKNIKVELQRSLSYAKPKFTYFNDGHPTVSVVVPLTLAKDVKMNMNGGDWLVNDFHEAVQFKFADENNQDGLLVPNCSSAKQTVQILRKDGYLSPYANILRVGSYEAHVNYQFPRGNEFSVITQKNPVDSTMWDGCGKNGFNYLIGKKFFIIYPAIMNGSREKMESFVVDSIGEN